jgi:hypothetical protein
MHCKVLSIAVAIVTLLAAAMVRAQSIGIYFDPQAANCSANIPANTPGTLYFIARLGGSAANGIAGAEFRGQGFPAGWFSNPLPGGPGIPEVPDPFSAEGARIAFPCQTGSAGLVVLAAVGYFATSLVSNHYIAVVSHNPPSDPSLQCPALALCDAPVFTLLCAAGGQAIINGPPCTVSTVQASWTRIRGLYAPAPRFVR